MKNLFLIATLSVTLFSCKPPNDQLGLAANYFPNSQLMEDGVVNKYYSHFQPNNGDAILTDIYYEHYQLTGDQQITVKKYNAGLEFMDSKILSFTNDTTTLIDYVKIIDADTCKAKIMTSTWMYWGGNMSATSHVIFKPGEENAFSIQQEHRAIQDTTVDGKLAKNIKVDLEVLHYKKQDSVQVFAGRFYNTYVKGFGKYKVSAILQKGKLNDELVEQMPFSQFEKLPHQGLVRIGHIDPEKTLDKYSDFQPCGARVKIGDYYSADTGGHLSTGKTKLRDEIFSKLDPKKLHSASGYLTFRFIVNCHGESGNFTTEQADLNFKKKKFDPETISHLYELVSELGPWSPPAINGKSRDAYFYITFRLKNGEIIEILP